jgi:hypothetical protein
MPETAVSARTLEVITVSAPVAFSVPLLEAAVSELLQTPPHRSLGLNEGITTFSTSASLQGNFHNLQIISPCYKSQS